jgi:hypothetical protein
MATPYRLVYSDAAVAVLCELDSVRSNQVRSDLQRLAKFPFVRSDYTVSDQDGRPLEFILVGDFVFGYFLDHAVSEFRVVDLSEVS